MWSLNVFHSDRRETPETSGPRPKVILSHFYSFPCQRANLHRCLESGTEKPLIRLGISTFISILNFLNSLRNQSDQTVLILNRPSCLIPYPFSLLPRSNSLLPLDSSPILHSIEYMFAYFR
jgi:hypothetical protein